MESKLKTLLRRVVHFLCSGVVDTAHVSSGAPGDTFTFQVANAFRKPFGWRAAPKNARQIVQT
jgi:hypothetical protein